MVSPVIMSYTLIITVQQVYLEAKLVWIKKNTVEELIIFVFNSIFPELPV